MRSAYDRVAAGLVLVAFLTSLLGGLLHPLTIAESYACGQHACNADAALHLVHQHEDTHHDEALCLLCQLDLVRTERLAPPVLLGPTPQRPRSIRPLQEPAPRLTLLSFSSRAPPTA